MRYTGPKVKLMRREGMDLGLKSKSPKSFERRGIVAPGEHGARGRKRLSEYATQLREKQKIKRIYGMSEKQFHGFFKAAAKARGNTGEMFLVLLERRLDNAVYRLGFANTRNMARQFVTHGHILVNGKKVSIPSYIINIGEVITLSSKAQKHPVVVANIKEKDYNPPKWLQRKAIVGQVKDLPKREDIDLEINEQLIIEFYSR